MSGAFDQSNASLMNTSINKKLLNSCVINNEICDAFMLKEPCLVKNVNA